MWQKAQLRWDLDPDPRNLKGRILWVVAEKPKEQEYDLIMIGEGNKMRATRIKGGSAIAYDTNLFFGNDPDREIIIPKEHIELMGEFAENITKESQDVWYARPRTPEEQLPPELKQQEINHARTIH